MSLANIKGKLSRKEMKTIMAGSGSEVAVLVVSCSSMQKTSKSSDCCSGMAVQGNYPPCGGDRGLVCLLVN